MKEHYEIIKNKLKNTFDKSKTSAQTKIIHGFATLNAFLWPLMICFTSSYFVIIIFCVDVFACSEFSSLFLL